MSALPLSIRKSNLARLLPRRRRNWASATAVPSGEQGKESKEVASIARIGDYGYDKDGLAFSGTFWSAFLAIRAARVYLRSGGPDPDIAFPHQLPGMISRYVRDRWREFRAFVRRRR